MNNVVIVLNDGNVVVVLLYSVEKFVKGSHRNFGLDMAYRIIPDTSQLILCKSNRRRIAALIFKMHIFQQDMV